MGQRVTTAYEQVGVILQFCEGYILNSFPLSSWCLNNVLLLHSISFPYVCNKRRKKLLDKAEMCALCV